MTMSIASSPAEPVCDMNTTPLIDVMLVLLIMFIITLPIMTHAVKLDMPRPPPHPQPPAMPAVIDLDIDFDGTVLWNGAAVPTLQTLESYFRADSAKEVQPEVHLRADRRAKYGAVAVVLAAAQRNHMQKISFVNTAEFRD
jgi:biopolymer transport protein ExbD